MSIVDDIKDLKAKRDEAQTQLTKYKTQFEGLLSEKETLVKELADKYGVTPDTAREKLDKMVEKRDELLQTAKDVLGKIPTQSLY